MGLVACTVAQASDDELCRRIAAFADAAPAEKPHEVTILTDWGEEQTVGCRRDESAAARKLCEWLPLHVSIEFMQGNVARVFECFTGESRRAPNDVAGKIRVPEPHYVKTKVWIELEFSTTGKEGELAFLTIRSGRRD